MAKRLAVSGRHWLTDLDRDVMLADDAELARAEADYERWLSRQPTSTEGYDPDRDDPNRYSDDPYDRLEREGGHLG